MPAILTRWFRPASGQLAADEDWFGTTPPAACRPEAAAQVSVPTPLPDLPLSVVAVPEPTSPAAPIFEAMRPVPTSTSDLHPDDNWFNDEISAPVSSVDDRGNARAVASSAVSTLPFPSSSAARRAMPVVELPQSSVEATTAEAGHRAEPDPSTETRPSEAPEAVDLEDWPELGVDGFADAPASQAGDTASPADDFWDDDLTRAPDEEDLPPHRVDPVERERCLRRAGQRAAALALVLDLPTPAAQRSAVRRLTELFKMFPHGATHAAIGRVVDGGISLDHLETAAEIILRWRRDPGLWLIRRFDRLERRWTVRRDESARHAFHWSDAARLASVADGIEEAESLLSEWQDEWVHLSSRADDWWSLADFVRGKLALLQASPTRDDERHDSDDDGRWDGYHWHHRLIPEHAVSVAPDGRLAYHARSH